MKFFLLFAFLVSFYSANNAFGIIDLFEGYERNRFTKGEERGFTLNIGSGWEKFSNKQLSETKTLIQDEINKIYKLDKSVDENLILPLEGYYDEGTGEYFLIKYSDKNPFSSYSQVEKYIKSNLSKKSLEKLSGSGYTDLNSSKWVIDKNYNSLTSKSQVSIDGKIVKNINVLLFGSKGNVVITLYTTQNDFSNNYKSIIDGFKWNQGYEFIDIPEDGLFEKFFLAGTLGILMTLFTANLFKRKNNSSEKRGGEFMSSLKRMIKSTSDLANNNRMKSLVTIILFIIIVNYFIYKPIQEKNKYNTCIEKVSNYYYYGRYVKENEEYIGKEGNGKSVVEKRQDYCIKKIKYQ